MERNGIGIRGIVEECIVTGGIRIVVQEKIIVGTILQGMLQTESGIKQPDDGCISYY